MEFELPEASFVGEIYHDARVVIFDGCDEFIESLFPAKPFFNVWVSRYFYVSEELPKIFMILDRIF